MDQELPELPTPIPLAEAAVTPIPLTQLGYAPPVRGARHPWAMFLWGIGSSAIAVGLVFLASLFLRTDVLSWELYYVVPVGSLLVSAIAAIGYVIGARLTGVRMRSGIFIAVLVLQFLTYVAGEYVQFAPHHYVHRGSLKPVGFFEFMHMKTMSWTTTDLAGASHALGGVGYLLVIIQLVAFVVFGALIGAGAAAGRRGAKGYCDLCKLYLKYRRIAIFPAGPPPQKTARMSAEERAEYRELLQEQMQEAVDGAELMISLASGGDVQALRDVVQSVRADQRRIARLPSKLELSMEYCPGCRRTTLRATLHAGSIRRRLGECEISNEFAGGF